jgi:Na+-driven multidrug efflux pump
VLLKGRTMINTTKTIESLRRINYRLFFSVLISRLLPIIYTTLRISFLGNLPDTWGFNIASQIAWVNLIYEVIFEALLLPIFNLIGKKLSDEKEFQNRVRTGIILFAVVYAVVSTLISIFAYPLVSGMAQGKEIIHATVDYIRLETVAIMLSSIYRFAMVVFIVLQRDKLIYILLTVQMLFTVLFDSLFISELSVSLHLGVNGVAFSNIIVNAVLIALSFYLFHRLGIRIFCSIKKSSLAWIKEWIRLGSLSGIESFVRNFAFILMILRMVNVVNEQGTFWVTNNFIWGWLLLPVLSLGEIIKRDAAEDPDSIGYLSKGFFALTGVFMLFWALNIPAWPWFLEKVMNAGNPDLVYHIALISIGFYVIFAFNNVVDSIFYGIGRIDLMLVQSIIVNSLFYGTLFILFQLNLFHPTLEKIAIMFGTGMALDSIITFLLFTILLRRKGGKNVKRRFVPI